MKNSVKTFILLIALMAVFPTILLADSLPDYYPSGFRFSGTIDRLDISNNILVVNDTLLEIQNSTKIFTPNTQFGTLNQLKDGMKVGAALRSGTNAPLISELWVLPDDYRFQRSGR